MLCLWTILHAYKSIGLSAASAAVYIFFKHLLLTKPAYNTLVSLLLQGHRNLSGCSPVQQVVTFKLRQLISGFLALHAPLHSAYHEVPLESLSKLELPAQLLHPPLDCNRPD